MANTYRGYTLSQITGAIDHSVLKPESQPEELIQAAAVARQYATASICVRPIDVDLVASELAGSGVPVCTVIGFPHGTSTTATKVFETVEALGAGATEVDMVLNISALIAGNDDVVRADIASVVAAAHGINPASIVKVIFETALLNREQIIRACELAEAAGADFVKTSTGFANSGATVENIQLMKQCVGDRLKVKASGGVRTLDQVIDLLEAGADRCGASGTEKIVAEYKSRVGLLN